MALIAIGWAPDDRVHWTKDGETVHLAWSLDSLAEKLAEPHTFLCHPFFYDFNSAERRYLSQELAEHGHTLVDVSGRALTVLEAASERTPSRSPVKRLFAAALVAADGLDRTIAAGQDWRGVRDALDLACAVAEFEGSEPGAVSDARAALGPYGALDPELQLALGDGTDYAPDLLRAVSLAAGVATNRPDFERYLAFTAGGARGPIGRIVHAWYVERNTGSAGFQRESVLTWSSYRHALRQAYRQIASARRSGLARCA